MRHIHGRTARSIAMLAPVLAMALTGAGPGGQAATAPPFTTTLIDPGGFEPRIAAAPGGRLWVGTQDAGTVGAVNVGSGAGHEAVLSSGDSGVTWRRTPSAPVPSQSPCCDNDIIVTRTGRVIASIIDLTAADFDVQYTDDGGETWHPSSGVKYGDQDREWLAAGPDDPTTHLPTVYMLWHNLASGAADHEMFVSTSHDNGATFGTPVPTTPAGSPAWLDLQCADSGGPSNIFTNPRTGDVYAVFGTRSSQLGGCGASALGAFEINIVAATRVWVARSTDGGATWTDSLAVDDSQAGNIVGMQVNAGAIDNAGNVYVVYPESPNPYPNYDGAAVRYRHAPADLSSWSAPVTVAPAGGPGHILTYMVAGDPGKLGFFYLAGSAQPSGAPIWYAVSALTLDGLDAAPAITEVPLSDVPTWQGTASNLMGICNPVGGSQAPPFDLVNGAANNQCPRSSDVLGMTLDQNCHFSDVWYASSLAAQRQGTYVSTQSGGPALGPSCSVAGMAPAVAGTAAGVPAGSSVQGVSSGPSLPNTSSEPVPVAPLLLLLAPMLAVIRRTVPRGRCTRTPAA
ncbi:MAG: sialidase family protein [Candidatus Dormibacteria bacterium]